MRSRTGNQWTDFWLGFEVGGRILRGKYNDKKIVGVELAKEACLGSASREGRKVFLLGGLPGIAEKLAHKHKSVIGYELGYSRIKLQKNDVQLNNRIVNKINAHKPDLLLVGLGRFEQEKWIARNLESLKVKAVMGVGSSFDELTGYGPWATPAPEWVDRMGLKWAWRAVKDPKHIRRAWNAFPVFAWRIYTSPK